MRISISTSNNINYKNKKRFQCCGKGCKSIGTTQLRIVYLNKLGWFCDPCKRDLLKLGLVQLEVEN